MGQKLSPSELELYERVHDALLKVWDPIGISDMEDARDEYNAYLPRIFGMVKAGEKKAAIIVELLEIERGRMGLTPNLEKADRAAEVLLRLGQLTRLREAVARLLPLLDPIPELRARRPQYEALGAAIGGLLKSGFDRDVLNDLSRAVPRLFWLHKEWTPPDEPWFKAVDEADSAVYEAAAQLRYIGER